MSSMIIARSRAAATAKSRSSLYVSSSCCHHSPSWRAAAQFSPTPATALATFTAASASRPVRSNRGLHGHWGDDECNFHPRRFTSTGSANGGARPSSSNKSVAAAASAGGRDHHRGNNRRERIAGRSGGGQRTSIRLERERRASSNYYYGNDNRQRQDYQRVTNNNNYANNNINNNNNNNNNNNITNNTSNANHVHVVSDSSYRDRNRMRNERNAEEEIFLRNTYPNNHYMNTIHRYNNYNNATDGGVGSSVAGNNNNPAPSFSYNFGQRSGRRVYDDKSSQQQSQQQSSSSSSSSSSHSRDIEKVWKETSTNGTGEDGRDRRRRHNLLALLQQTTNNISTFNPSQVRNIAQYAATIVKNHNNSNNTNSSSRSAAVLEDTLVQSKDAHEFWSAICHQSTQRHNLDYYKPKWLVSVSWAIATIIPLQQRGMVGAVGGGGKVTTDIVNNDNNDNNNNNNNTAIDISSYFHAIHTTYNKRKNEFNLKHMGNLVWSCVTCNNSSGGSSSSSSNMTAVNTDADLIMSKLLNDFANDFINRCRKKRQEVDGTNSSVDNYSANTDDDDDDDDDDGLDPMTLAQWANSYAKAGYVDDNLYREISLAAVPMLDRFDSRHFANLTYAFALAGLSTSSTLPELEELLDEIAIAAIPKIHTFSTLHIANIVWSYAKLNHPSTIFFDVIANVATTSRIHDFSSQQLATLVWAYSKFPQTKASNSIFNAVASEVAVRGLDSFTMQGIAMLAHSFAFVGYENTTLNTLDFWNAIDNATTTRSDELGVIESSQIVWSFATIGRCPSDELFAAIEKFNLSNIHKMKSQGLSNLAWSLATLGRHDDDDESTNLFRIIAEESIQRLDEFTPEDEVMLVLAYSRMTNNHTSFLKDLLEHIALKSLSHLDKYTELDLFNMVVSYVKSNCHNRQWMEAMACEIIRRPSSAFSLQVVIGIAWAYASAGCHEKDLLNYISDICITRCDELKTKEVASLAWSFVTLDYHHRPLLTALAESSKARWPEFDAASIANMAWAYSTARADMPRLFEGIASVAMYKRDEFKSQGVSMLIWSYAAIGHVDRSLLTWFEPMVKSVLRECNCQSLTNIAWTYAVADINADSLFGPESPFIDIIIEKYDKFDSRGLCQLHQWNIWRKEIADDANYSALPMHIAQRCYEEFTNQLPQSSELQKDIMSTLTLMGIEVEEEVRTQSGYSLDAVVRDVNGKSIGLEVDGPHHFVNKKPTGSTILKHRQVAAIDGMPFISVPYWEWNDLGQSTFDKQQYLRDKLKL